MKSISRLYQYDDRFFEGKIPGEAQYLPDADKDYPIYLKENFLSNEQCDQLIRQMTTLQPGVQAETKAGNRHVTTYYLNGTARKIYKKAFRKARPEIEKFFNARLSTDMRAHGLAYSPGGKYSLHCDNCNPVMDSNNRITAFKLVEPDRQFSSLIYLSDYVEQHPGPNQFTGGTLSFNFLFDKEGNMLVLKPKKGMCVSFPSNPVFSHQAHPVKTGFRVAIVDWHSAEYFK